MANPVFDHEAHGAITSGTTLNVSHTMGTVSNGVVVVFIGDQGNGAGPNATPTYAGQTMTAIHTGDTVTAYYLVNPPAGTNTCAIGFAGAPPANQSYTASVLSYSGVNQLSPVVSSQFTNSNGAGTGTDAVTGTNINGATSDAMIGFCTGERNGSSFTLSPGTSYNSRSAFETISGTFRQEVTSEDRLSGVSAADKATWTTDFTNNFVLAYIRLQIPGAITGSNLSLMGV